MLLPIWVGFAVPGRACRGSGGCPNEHGAACRFRGASQFHWFCLGGMLMKTTHGKMRGSGRGSGPWPFGLRRAGREADAGTQYLFGWWACLVGVFAGRLFEIGSLGPAAPRRCERPAWCCG